jgi:hypothetical protein
MIRKLLLGAVVVLFLYTVWNFYTEALSYDPMTEITAKQPKIKGTEGKAAAYSSAWSTEILEKNLFSPNRTYLEPKPIVFTAPVPPPRRPELALRGIVQNSSGEYVAYIEIDKAKAAPMRKGDKLEDVEVIDISARGVVLQWNKETINMSIEKVRTLDNPRMIK